MPLSVAVAGASGYAGGELLRLLSAHPDLDVTTVTAHQNAGSPLAAHQPHLRSLAHLTLQETTPEVLAGHDVVLLALPHGRSGEIAATLPASTLVVDAGADHRLESEEDWAEYYGGEHFGAWTYGMPELVLADGSKQREALRGARRIAVPGCNVTAVTLGLAPAIRAGVVEAKDLVSVLAVGPSGAGRTLRTDLLAAELLGSAHAYGVGGAHRHNPEIRQNLVKAGASAPTLSFTPVLVPMSRGIHATNAARLAPGATAADVRAAFADAYAGEAFVQLLPEGAQPRSADTVGANTCLVGIAVDERAGRVTTFAVLDNLVKGTAGAAIQSVNLALGLPEATGLTVDGVAP
ncbi:MAG: N-acetyl-gamma-glutamyl-phosphate reductase [Micrococcales bacterium 73-13]|nr:MAG: N-acetyl-gamma-glutamyl-phosphate reductase [Micrococcales bacterium 73-13]